MTNSSGYSNGSFSILFLLFLTIFAHVCQGIEPSEDSVKLSRGWGKHIHWKTLSEGLTLAQKLDKPVMLIIHKTWCGACKRLKEDFSVNPQIARMAKDFIMVNVQDEEEPKHEKYAPDGGYIPRILFVDGHAKVRVEHSNEHGNPKYRFFYSSSDEVILSMKKVLDIWKYKSDGDLVDGGEGQVYDEL